MESKGANVGFLMHLDNPVKDILRVRKGVELDCKMVTDVFDENSMCLLILDFPRICGPGCGGTSHRINGDVCSVWCWLRFCAWYNAPDILLLQLGDDMNLPYLEVVHPFQDRTCCCVRWWWHGGMSQRPQSGKYRYLRSQFGVWGVDGICMLECEAHNLTGPKRQWSLSQS
jgi:hypothetical protein